MAKLRFVRAIDDARPYGTHRYDVYGPKVHRRLTLFGHRALNAWLQLEFNPDVVAYCERPLFVSAFTPARPVDFWVKTTDGEHLLFCLRASESRSNAKQPDRSAILEAWAKKSGFPVRIAEPDGPVATDVLRRNQATILQHVAAGHTFVTDTMKRRALDEFETGASLLELEHRLSPVESVLARTVAFTLLHDGCLNCPTLAREEIGPHTRLVRG
ncbi:hypothetical protein A6V36_36990 [Paraburkholderia ginsengiterrae]|uniref:TnsA endonuclease N-terminal domain-containing protein n=1 Tax=Paraburkholderia ginsengiterrae TaxID=1462993 RepID=A0A1A9N1R0_9BURK|nr:hypothetical protein [Paraburkholderia ginsengiterrae]OAJ53583.1 hypothetical protein A6V36_36990 [Paraburkholderia ginsengiterrae]OAJ55312.1 hypothetical protein A6V37_33055 [Paraburkholderia ginsengiterrae]